MSFTIPPAKRRRYDTASATLSKPFKSPLRKPQPSTENPTPPSSATNSDPKKESEQKSNEETKELKEANPPITPSSSRTPNPAMTPKTPPSTKLKPVDPTLSALQKNHRALQSRLAALRSELDTVSQAYRIETSSKDVELEALVAKWRAVAQNAADEVFIGARERVIRMGGMMKYRERIRSSAAVRWEEEETEGWFGGRTDPDAEEDMGREEEKEKEDEKNDEEEEEEFTMEFMLKTLNIDPKTIGYDTTGQRWVK